MFRELLFKWVSVKLSSERRTVKKVSRKRFQAEGTAGVCVRNRKWGSLTKPAWQALIGSDGGGCGRVERHPESYKLG